MVIFLKVHNKPEQYKEIELDVFSEYTKVAPVLYTPKEHGGMASMSRNLRKPVGTHV